MILVVAQLMQKSATTRSGGIASLLVQTIQQRSDAIAGQEGGVTITCFIQGGIR